MFNSIQPKFRRWLLAIMPLFLVLLISTLLPSCLSQDATCGPEDETCASDSIAIEDDCRDNHDNCIYWASEGECHKNYEYMSTTCPVSCDMCDRVQNNESPNKK